MSEGAGMAGGRSPRGGYFLTPEFHMWPDVQAAGPTAIGVYVSCGIWAAAYGYDADLPRYLLRQVGGSRATAAPLVRVGLWGETEEGYRPVTLTQLMVRRGYRGTVMRLSRLIPSSPAGARAGAGALGAYFLAASWSLTTFRPGFIPREAVMQLGLNRHVPNLCRRTRCSLTRWDNLWERVPGGYLMTDGDHPYEARWQLSRNDEREPIPDDVRRRVYARDSHRCVHCGSGENLALDHIYPWIRGGADTEDNLQTLCRPCNSSKGARLYGT